jgi:outer membrane protein assembly factor BamB
MKRVSLLTVAFLSSTLLANPVQSQEWVQWRGNHRDGVVTGFSAPEKWPAELTKKWSVEVGDGVSSPSVAANRVYIMALQDGQEVMRCLDAATGDELWKDSYAARAASGPASGFAGTRSSPAIAEGHVVTLGVDGTVSCWEAETGQLSWRNEDFTGEVPQFSTSSSPLIQNGLCIAQFGGERDGGVVAWKLATGKEAWKWTGAGTSYASPVVTRIGSRDVVIVPTSRSLVALSATDGTELWSMEYVQGRYNAATPVVHGQTILLAGPGRGITAIELAEEGDKIVQKEVWRNEDQEATALYNSAVIAGELLFGLSSSNQLFCVNTTDGKLAWSAPAPGAPAQTAPPQGGPPGGAGSQDPGRGGRQEGQQAGGEQPGGNRPGGDRPGGGGGGRGRGGRGGGRGGYGSIVSVGSALVGLTPASELFVYEPSGDSYKELAKYKVSETPTYAYPVLVGNQILIKDKNSLTLWSVE